MANSKSARKRIRVAQRRHDSRRPYISACRTMVKKAVLAIQSGDESVASVAVVNAVRMLDRSAGKGIIHRNNAARRKSRLMHKYNSRTAAA
ncbi:MAG: SSU ribosomal protein S20p [uncultured Thermomicrobiales bacterium]|uniref:Small ribosomal subunit protein bS20 n=1 Tax=uncultured Thermomicrobiales bacterium TaxID=1645740 RepID=A0A6J4V8W0_9BACT|nr:MAG: SSU ribosomal protein S20p [uncultured Thermomicrobiales bacterium]